MPRGALFCPERHSGFLVSLRTVSADRTGVQTRPPRPGTTSAILLLISIATLACAELRAFLPYFDPQQDFGRHFSQDPPLDLSFNRWTSNRIHCDAGDCEAWYAVDVDEATDARFRVYSEQIENGPDFHLVLLGPKKNLLARSAPHGRSPRKIDTALAPGRYWIGLIATGKHDGALPFEIALSRVKGYAKSNGGGGRENRALPDPRESTVLIQLVEVAEDGTAVTLAVGSTAGVRLGVRGELSQRGVSIGQFEIIEVAKEQSRALILGPLRGAVSDPTTRATIPHLPH